MYTTDFSFLGGFPFSQYTLKRMQDGMLQIGTALASMGWDGSAYPLILAGCVYDSGSLNVTDGWMYYQGEVMYFQGGNIGVDGQFITLLDNRQAGIFADLQSKDIYVDRQLVLSTTANANDITTDVIKRVHDVFGKYTEYNDWNTIAVPSGSTGNTGTIYYRINHLSQHLHIKGSITITNAQALSNPPLYYLIANLAAPYRPAETAPFSAYVRYHSALYILEANGTEHITSVNGELSSAGDLSFGLIKPDAAISAYTVYFNTQIPLL